MSYAVHPFPDNFYTEFAIFPEYKNYDVGLNIEFNNPRGFFQSFPLAQWHGLGSWLLLRDIWCGYVTQTLLSSIVGLYPLNVKQVVVKWEKTAGGTVSISLFNKSVKQL